jgi:hypothetical protein
MTRGQMDIDLGRTAPTDRKSKVKVMAVVYVFMSSCNASVQTTYDDGDWAMEFVLEHGYAEGHSEKIL